MLPSEENCPGDSSGVFALQEEGLGFAILEAEYLAVATDVEFTLVEIAYQYRILSWSPLNVFVFGRGFGVRART